MKPLKNIVLSICILTTGLMPSVLYAKAPTCPPCQKNFPDDYNYCPYCGKILQKHITLSAEDIIVNSIGMKLKLIRSGLFMMGSTNDSNERPIHRVRLTKPFYIGIYEVTQHQYEKVMDANPSRFKRGWRPVECVSWNNAQKFCQRLSKMENRLYRLPTEAEWEYAYRAGTITDYYWGNDFDSQYAWSNKNSTTRATHDVGTRLPNAWGLYDMGGNVWEWCEDWYGRYYSERQSEEVDPIGPLRGSEKVLRGGSCLEPPHYCRSAFRVWISPQRAHESIGFRIVLDSNFSGIGSSEPATTRSETRRPEKREDEATCSLTVVVTTPLLQIFSLKEHDLTVTVSGPVSRTKTEKSVDTAMAKSFVFSGIPEGEYTITATYGKKRVSKKVKVSGDMYELQMTF